MPDDSRSHYVRFYGFRIVFLLYFLGGAAFLPEIFTSNLSFSNPEIVELAVEFLHLFGAAMAATFLIFQDPNEVYSRHV